MDHYITDIELYISPKLDICRVHTKTRRDTPSGHNGKVTVRKVSKKEMEKQWK